MGAPTRYELSDLLEQDRVWQDGSGQVWKLTEMDRKHRANLVVFLMRRADSLQYQEISRLLNAPDDLDGELRQLEDLTASQYMRSKPLYRKLIELNQGHPLDGPDYEPLQGYADEASRVSQPTRPDLDLGKLFNTVFPSVVDRQRVARLRKYLDTRIAQLNQREPGITSIVVGELELVRAMLTE